MQIRLSPAVAAAPSLTSPSAPPAAKSAPNQESSFNLADVLRSIEVRPQRRAGPVNPQSPQGIAAAATALNNFSAGVENDFKVRSIEQDELGLTHVRLDRQFDGLRVFPEQIIAHLKEDGSVAGVTGRPPTPIPHTLEEIVHRPNFSEEAALGRATADFAAPLEKAAKTEKVITRADDGSYRVAYLIELQNLHHQDGPKRQFYLFDADSGEQLQTWNQLGTFAYNKMAAGLGSLGQAAAAQAPAPVPNPNLKSVDVTATPGAVIADNSKVESTISVADDFKVGNLSLTLDVDHTYRGDLMVSLTSPSGKVIPVSTREGGEEDNLKGTFDLSEALEGEQAAGDWKLTIEDRAAGDVGKLNSWRLSAIELDPNRPPPPPPPEQTPDDVSIYAGTVGIGASVVPTGGFKLTDSTRGRGVETRDSRGNAEFTDANNLWGEATDNTRAAAAVDAQYGGQMTYDFYKEIAGRDSIDGHGEKLNNVVHEGTNYVNAYWDGRKMHYGDGDGSQASVLTTLDVAGHEITHGLTERTAGLIYSGESGGLNEAFSDILGGAGVEWYALQHNPELEGKANPYFIGEQCWTPRTAGDALRYMDDPTRDNYSVDNYRNYPRQTEVHGSSGIANNAFYLLTHGGRNKTSGIEVTDAIGMEKGLRIFSRALIYYMTPNTTFREGKQACARAAADLYGAESVEVAKVNEAWTAVGV